MLVILGFIVVGIAIAVGIWMFRTNAMSSDRDEVINDLNNLAVKAQQYFRVPSAIAGGGQSFGGFYLAPIDTANGNGLYSITAIGSSPSVPTPGDYTSSVNTGTTGAPEDTVIIICGWGNEIGNDGVNKVQAYVTIKNNTITGGVIN
jgi:hypothetical protein